MLSNFDIPEISREDQPHMINAAADITEELQADTIMIWLTRWDDLVGQAQYITLIQVSMINFLLHILLIDGKLS